MKNVRSSYVSASCVCEIFSENQNSWAGNQSTWCNAMISWYDMIWNDMLLLYEGLNRLNW